MTIGERIKKLREEKNITVDKLAELIGKNRATIYRYESSEIEKLPTSVLEPLCKALGTTPAYIMGWDDKTPEQATPLPQTNVFMRPVYDSISAGFGVIAQDVPVDYMPTYITCPSEQDKYIWINVHGDSMSPLIDDGSKFLLKSKPPLTAVRLPQSSLTMKRLLLKRSFTTITPLSCIQSTPTIPHECSKITMSPVFKSSVL